MNFVIPSISKTSVLILTAVSLILFTDCRSSKITGETRVIEKSTPGTIVLSSAGYGKIKRTSVNNAIENAARNILLRGIPDSNQSTPLLGLGAEQVFAKKKNYFENFFDKDLEKFVLRREILSYNFFNINTPSSEVLVSFNLDALRRHLEQDGIIRSFGI